MRKKILSFELIILADGINYLFVTRSWFLQFGFEAVIWSDVIPILADQNKSLTCALLFIVYG
ncbi:hypothetical protein TDB9533_00533 [Thalassocella blandensis]|nr:hypothetical protein TDB9533_00533 [Thalassocella blandensis]